MRFYVRRFFVVFFICSLTSFAEDASFVRGLDIGMKAPNFSIKSAYQEGDDVDQQSITSLKDMRGRCVLLSFWSSNDATSRLRNASISRAFGNYHSEELAFVSVSFDEYESVFSETVRMDNVHPTVCINDTAGKKSDIFRRYKLAGGMSNFLIDANGKVVAKNLSASDFNMLY